MLLSPVEFGFKNLCRKSPLRRHAVAINFIQLMSKCEIELSIYIINKNHKTGILGNMSD